MKTKKIFNHPTTIIFTILSVVLAFALVINVTLIYKTVIHKDEVPSVFGLYPLVVLSDSMSPYFDGGDLIICQNEDDIKVGDVIAYYSKNKSSITSHRVTKISKDDSGLLYKTKGDANNIEDDGYVSYVDIIGVYKTKIKYLGHLVLFMQSKIGFILCVLFPLFIVVTYEMVKKKRCIDDLRNELAYLKATE